MKKKYRMLRRMYHDLSDGIDSLNQRYKDLEDSIIRLKVSMPKKRTYVRVPGPFGLWTTTYERVECFEDCPIWANTRTGKHKNFTDPGWKKINDIARDQTYVR